MAVLSKNAAISGSTKGARALVVGTPVRFVFGVRPVNGRIVEDRGPIGVEGRRLYAIQFGPDADDEHVVELPDTAFELT